MDLILFILICYGLTQVLTIGEIFKSIRPKHVFFHCSMCVGFWVGILVFLSFYISNIILFPNILIGSFLFGCVSSGTSYFICRLIGEDGLNIHIG